MKPEQEIILNKLRELRRIVPTDSRYISENVPDVHYSDGDILDYYILDYSLNFHMTQKALTVLNKLWNKLHE